MTFVVSPPATMARHSLGKFSLLGMPIELQLIHRATVSSNFCAFQLLGSHNSTLREW